MKAKTDRDPGRDWMLAFQGGDEDAFEQLVKHYHAGVRRFVGRYLSDRDRAEDMAQEAFVRVYKARERYQPTAKFHTWLFTIVTRLCLNEIRSVRRERRAITIQRRFGVSSSENRDVEDPIEAVEDANAETPAHVLEREELQSVLDEAIQELPKNQRVAILLLRFHDASYAEIAEVLEVSTMAVKSLVNRARETLRSKLQRYRTGSGTLSGSCES